MKRILVATDGSPSALEATRFGIELAAEHEAELVIAHVVPEINVVPATVLQIGGVFPHEPTAHDLELLEDAAAFAAEHGITATTALLRGETVAELVEYAAGRDVELVVVGSRGAAQWRARCSAASRRRCSRKQDVRCSSSGRRPRWLRRPLGSRPQPRSAAAPMAPPPVAAKLGAR